MPQLTDFFMNPMALVLSLLIIPIIILYLLKPKPKHVKFPSIMFILRIEKTKRFSSWFKRFVRDPLLLLQILILLLLIFSLADPFFIFPSRENPKSDVVFILDGSASMQSTDLKPNRFEKAKELALNLLQEDVNPESRVSIIFAENMPILLLRNSGDKEIVKKILEKLQPIDSASNLQDSMLFANDLLSDSKLEKKIIYVFSDFSNVGDVKLAKGISMSKGIDVKFLKVIKGGKNLGITNMNAKRFPAEREKFSLTFTVKNFNQQEEEVISEVLLDKEKLTSILRKISANSEELFYVQGEGSLDEHILEIKIKSRDDLEIDNHAYWILPEVKKYKILLITNHDTYLKHALESNLDFFLTIANPPIVPKFDDFDTIILGEFDSDLILPGMFLELRDYLKENGNLVILASEGLNRVQDEDLKELLPIRPEDVISATSRVKVEREHEALKDVILENVILKKYIKGSKEKNNETVVIATSKNSPLIAYMDYGEGKVTYVGINPNPVWSNFYLSSSFPIFWFQLIKWINKKELLDARNFKAGEYLSMQREITLKTPSAREFSTKEIILDEIGVYEVNLQGLKEKISVNLENEKESEIQKSLDLETITDPENLRIIQQEASLEENFLWKYLLIFSLVLLLIEAILYKRRGLV